MPKRYLRVVAVVPAYNAERTIGFLLDELIAQKYDAIFVLDDASADETAKIVRSYGNKVTLIENDENVGAGANRNRIIGRVEPCILHFIDADMQLISKNTPQTIRNIAWPKDTAYIGGMVRNPDGSQNAFNFGPRASFIALLQSWVQFGVWLIGHHFEPLARFLQSLFYPVLRNWPNIYQAPRRRRTFWTAESNMVIRSDTYEQLGGYDPIFRYSEIEDLALRLHRLGLKTYFDPRIDVLHSSLDNIFHSRSKKREAFKKFTQKHGHITWVAPKLSDRLAKRHGNALEPSERRRRGMY